MSLVAAKRIWVGLYTCLFIYYRLSKSSFLGPGGLDDMGKHINCTGGAAGYIDRQVFGHHLLKNPDCKRVYENTAWFDPEGSLC